MVLKKPGFSKKLLILFVLMLLLTSLSRLFGDNATRTVAAGPVLWNQPVSSPASVSLISIDSGVYAGNCVADPSEFVSDSYQKMLDELLNDLRKE